MTGWMIFAGLALLVTLIAWRMTLPKGAFGMVAAALALAGAGYAAQGNPALPASPGQPEAQNEAELVGALIELRDMMDRNFGVHKGPMVLSDAALRRGDYPMALAVLSGALKRNPGNAELLNARAMAMFLASDAKLTPAVALALAQAKAPGWHPGPYYFEGLAKLSERQPDAALALWDTALTKGTPKGAWRVPVMAQRGALTAMLAEAAATEAAQAAVQVGAQ